MLGLSTPSAADAAKACIAEKAAELRSGFLLKVKAEVEKLDDSTLGASPIVLAIDQGVSPFLAEAKIMKVQIVAITDGLEHAGGKDPVGFYPIEGRFMSPSDAVSKTSGIGSNWGAVRVSMVGLGITASQDVPTASAMIATWVAIVASRQGVLGEFSTGAPLRLVD